MNRLPYDASLVELRRRGFLGPDEAPPLMDRMPSPLDEGAHGISFFRTDVEGDLSGLSLPRTFINRSGVFNCRFTDTDLSESFLCWNDFTDVDFSAARLKGTDLRGSSYTRVRFTGADLSGADLRRTSFEECDFTGAILTGAKASHLNTRGLTLSPEQKAQIEWSWLAGEEPPGG